VGPLSPNFWEETEFRTLKTKDKNSGGNNMAKNREYFNVSSGENGERNICLSQWLW
jgi:hypothetical protein